MRPSLNSPRIHRALLALLLLLAPVNLAAQDELDLGWERTLELAGSLLLGAEPQSVLTARAGASFADSMYDAASDFSFLYGTITSDGVRELTQRSWLGLVTVDFWHLARYSPFVLASVESSFERLIDRRLSGGAGYKVTFVRTDSALADFSLAVLGERSTLRFEGDSLARETLARWSARLRLEREIRERVSLRFESFYRPSLTGFGRYTSSIAGGVGYHMNDMLQLTLSYQDNFDSEAVSRGAESGYQGQVVVGVQADF